MRRISWPRLVFTRSAAGGVVDDDAEHFRVAVLPYLDAAYRYARFLSRDAAAAEDVVQEAFLRARRNIGQCRGNAKAWLLAIVRNCHHDLAKTNARYISGDFDHNAQIDPETPHTHAERGDEITHLRRTIEALPEPFREALVLRELEELSYREIAELTGAPIGTVMSRLARARTMLAGLLLGEQSDNSRKAGEL